MVFAIVLALGVGCSLDSRFLECPLFHETHIAQSSIHDDIVIVLSVFVAITVFHGWAAFRLLGCRNTPRTCMARRHDLVVCSIHLIRQTMW